MKIITAILAAVIAFGMVSPVMAAKDPATAECKKQVKAQKLKGDAAKKAVKECLKARK